MLYCLGSGREILSASTVFMCHDFSYVNDCGAVKVTNPITSSTPLSNAIMGSSMMTSIANLHTDYRYLGFNSQYMYERKHKISTSVTLLPRALNLPNSKPGKACKTAQISTALQSY